MLLQGFIVCCLVLNLTHAIFFELKDHQCEQTFDARGVKSCGGCLEPVQHEGQLTIKCVCYFGELACPNGHPQHCNPLKLC
uniref:Uncharacterized protein n=1 Tax=Romanomermis culicivorax TaxID=13658 RepID=A0A915J816_ROMCU